MYSISAIAKMCGLTRTSLIYYDSIGLLCPGRSEAGYRMYSEDDLLRLQQICMYRNTGLSLEDIRQIFSQKKSTTTELLEKRLRELNVEISELREQQKLIVDILGSEQLIAQTKVLSKDRWIEILRRSGLNEDDMDKWHEQFEQCAPQAHQDFLESLGIPEDEIRRIRKKCVECS